MSRIIVATADGQSHEIDYRIGSTVMEVIRDAGIDGLTALCGGVLSCATCHVCVAPEFNSLLPEMSEDEDMMLEGVENRADGSRLSCQIRLTAELSGLKLTIPEQE